MPNKCHSPSLISTVMGRGAAAFRVPRQGRQDTERVEAERGSQGATDECGGRGHAGGGQSVSASRQGRPVSCCPTQSAPRPGRPSFEALAPDMCCHWLCLTLCNPVDFSSPGSSVHGILQARILEWVAMPSPRESSQSRDQTRISYFSKQLLYCWCHLESLLQHGSVQFSSSDL